MTPDIARQAMVLLQRCQLQGAEVPAYLAVMEALRQTIDGAAPSQVAPANGAQSVVEACADG